MNRIHVKRRSEFIVVALLAGFAGLLFWDTINAPADVMQRGPVGPQTMPFVVASLLLLCAVILAVDLLRGGQGKPEEGEAGERSDWKTCGIIAAAVLLTAAVMESVGWVVAGGVMFYLCVYAFGSRHYIRDFVVSAGMAVGSFYLFFSGLGIPLPAGLLQGVL
ncbi:tripartite tricarboxylate transporter TctB family protein (plasmid) [Paenarthrobacter ureafaciens]